MKSPSPLLTTSIVLAASIFPATAFAQSPGAAVFVSVLTFIASVVGIILLSIHVLLAVPSLVGVWLLKRSLPARSRSLLLLPLCVLGTLLSGPGAYVSIAALWWHGKRGAERMWHAFSASVLAAFATGAIYGLATYAACLSLSPNHEESAELFGGVAFILGSPPVFLSTLLWALWFKSRLYDVEVRVLYGTSPQADVAP